MADTAHSENPDGQEPRPGTTPAVHGRAPVLYVLTGDDTLLLELGPLLGTRYRTRPIDSTEQITPSNTSPWALMIDASARGDARAQAARVKQQYPAAPLLVICADGTTSDWANPLARGALTAIIERGALGSEAFETALSTADKQMAADDSGGRGAGASAGMAIRRMPIWMVTLGAFLVIAPATWYALHPHAINVPALSKSAPATSPPIAPVVPPKVATPTPAAASSRTVLELLSDARVAFSEGKGLLPPTEGSPTGNSALEIYAKVLAQDPQNEEAQDGLRRLFSVASARIRADLNANKVEEAERLLAAFRGVGIAPAALATLESEIVAARPHALAAQARTAITKGDSEGATQLIAQLSAAGGERAKVTELHDALDSQRSVARLTELANHGRALIKSGALLEPANDSAQSVVLSMQQLNRSSPLTLNIERELQSALIERALAASLAGQYDLAQQLLSSASILGNGAELTAARRQLQNEMDSSTRARPAPALAPTAVTVAASAPVSNFVRTKPLVPLDVAYPQRAFQSGQEGYVIVEFTLDAKGRATNPKVIESNPIKLFDEAALQAVKQGHFDTSEMGGSGDPQRARLRIAFKPTVKKPTE